MAGRYDKYVIDDPKLVQDLAHHDFSAVRGFSYPDPVYLDEELCPEAEAWLDIVWVWEKTVPEELPGLHVAPLSRDRAARSARTHTTSATWAARSRGAWARARRRSGSR